jgi:hypothetical protein
VFAQDIGPRVDARFDLVLRSPELLNLEPMAVGGVGPRPREVEVDPRVSKVGGVGQFDEEVKAAERRNVGHPVSEGCALGVKRPPGQRFFGTVKRHQARAGFRRKSTYKALDANFLFGFVHGAVVEHHPAEFLGAFSAVP